MNYVDVNIIIMRLSLFLLRWFWPLNYYYYTLRGDNIGFMILAMY